MIGVVKTVEELRNFPEMFKEINSSSGLISRQEDGKRSILESLS